MIKYIYLGDTYDNLDDAFEMAFNDVDYDLTWEKLQECIDPMDILNALARHNPAAYEEVWEAIQNECYDRIEEIEEEEEG